MLWEDSFKAFSFCSFVGYAMAHGGQKTACGVNAHLHFVLYHVGAWKRVRISSLAVSFLLSPQSRQRLWHYGICFCMIFGGCSHVMAHMCKVRGQLCEIICLLPCLHTFQGVTLGSPGLYSKCSYCWPISAVPPRGPEGVWGSVNCSSLPRMNSLDSDLTGIQYEGSHHVVSPS